MARETTTADEDRIDVVAKGWSAGSATVALKPC